MTGFDSAQAAYDSATSYDDRDVYDQDAPCVCVLEISEDGDVESDGNPDCRAHNEPPCDRCGWQGVCPDCDARRPWED